MSVVAFVNSFGNVAIYFQIILDRNRVQREARAQEPVAERLPNASARLPDEELNHDDINDTTSLTTSQSCVVCFGQAKEGTVNV